MNGVLDRASGNPTPGRWAFTTAFNHLGGGGENSGGLGFQNAEKEAWCWQ